MENVKMVDLIRLGKQDWAVISPNKIQFLKDAGRAEVENIIKEEQSSLAGAGLSTNVIQSQSFPSKVGLTLLPTFDCNLRCVYCYSKGGDNKAYMSKGLAKFAIDSITDHFEDKYLNLYFAGGGEPFLNFETMCFALDYSKSIFQHVNIGIVTNGTFSNEHLEWIAEHNISVRISFDGLAHDHQRPSLSPKGSRFIVENNIKKLVSLENSLTVQCIVTSDSVMQMADNVQYFADLGVESLKIEPVHMSEVSRGDSNLVPKPKVYVDQFIKMLRHIVENKLSIKIDTQYISRPTVGNYCGISEDNLIVTPEGFVTACVEVCRTTDPHSDSVLYGKLSSRDGGFSFNNEARQKLKKLHFQEYSDCPRCSLKLVCKGSCPMKGIWEHGFNLKASSINCLTEKLLLPRLFCLMMEDPQYSEIIFDSFDIEQLC